MTYVWEELRRELVKGEKEVLHLSFLCRRFRVITNSREYRKVMEVLFLELRNSTKCLGNDRST